MYLWLHIQFAINIDVIAWIYGYYIVNILLVDVVSVLVWRVLSKFP